MVPTNIADVLDVTWEDVDALMQKARASRAKGQASFVCEGRLMGVASIFEGTAMPIVQAIERLHAIRRDDHSQGIYRGHKLRG